MKTKLLLSALALSIASIGAHAADYFIVLPVKGKTYRASDIQVQLSGFALPQAKKGVPYAASGFSDALSVSGDPTFTGSGVSWRVSAGAVPAGLSFTNGAISGVAAAPGLSNFEVEAAYRGKAAVQAYSLQVNPPEVFISLGGQALTKGKVGTAYGPVSFEPLVTVTGDIPYTGSGLSWRVSDGTVPAGLTFNNGVLAGTPAAAGTSNFTLEATFEGASALTAYSLLIDPTITYAGLDPSTVSSAGCGSVSGPNNSIATALCGGTVGLSATAPKTTGKWYYEVRFPGGLNIEACQAGVVPATYPRGTHQLSIISGSNGIAASNLILRYNSNWGSVSGAAGSWIGLGFDLDSRYMFLYRGGSVWGPYPMEASAGTAVVPMVSPYANCQVEINTGNSAFVNPLPANFSGWTAPQ